MFRGRLLLGWSALVLAATIVTIFSIGISGQSGAPIGQWRTYGGDLGNTRYSPLAQVDAGNFNKLEVAWRFKTDSLGPRPEFEFQSTPLVVGSVLYTTAGSRRAVAALNAGTGEMLWVYSLDEGARAEAAPRKLSGRGLAYWASGRDERILYVTPGYQLVGLDAHTGQPLSGFGSSGIVDLKKDLDQDVDPINGDIGLHATPLVVGDVVVVGAAHTVGMNPRSMTNTKGFIRGFDVKTGKRLWTFHTIPRPGEFGNDTWEKDSWAYTGNTGVWAQMAADEKLGLVYLPVEAPTGDIYGGHRPGNNLFSDSLVALDVKTGRRAWHYQLIHHDIWDRDIPAGPTLADVRIDGRLTPIIIQPTKQAFAFVFDRKTGRPIWPIEERPVPKGDVPGEWYAPTQPFPTKPPAFDRQGISTDDLLNFTPELRREAEAVASKYRMGPLFTPPALSNAEGPLATLTVPETGGGANWQGGSFDPETGIFYIYSVTAVTPFGVVPADPKRTDMAYVSGQAGPQGNRGGGISVQGLPIIQPPWGRIVAIDMNKGETLWQIAHGETPDNVRTHPALKGLNIPRTGRPGRIGTLVTKTLVIAGEGGVFTTPTGQRGAMLRAYNKATGAEVGAVYMPAPQTGSPMTYTNGNKQYIVVAVSGGNYSGELLAFRLP